MGEKSGMWDNLTAYWPVTIILHHFDSSAVVKGIISSGGERIAGDEVFEAITAVPKNCTIWDECLEVGAVDDDDDQSVLTNVLASILFIFSIVSNLAVFVVTMYRIFRKKNKSAIHVFLWNLAVADILVSTVLLPLQAGWWTTDSWKSGEIVCQILGFFSSFAYFLSGFVVVCISVDRVVVVSKPFLVTESGRRAKLMLLTAWAAGILCSIPEAVLHHVTSSPFQPYGQCTSAGSYSSWEAELVHSLGKITLTGVPFVVILVCHLQILWMICRAQTDGLQRYSGDDLLGRAQVRALKLVIIISLAFSLCWIPSTVTALWLWYQPNNALVINPQVSKVIFLLPFASPCINPFVYGIFHVKD